MRRRSKQHSYADVFKREAYLDGMARYQPGSCSDTAARAEIRMIEAVQGKPLDCTERLWYRVYFCYGWFRRSMAKEAKHGHHI